MRTSQVRFSADEGYRVSRKSAWKSNNCKWALIMTVLGVAVVVGVVVTLTVLLPAIVSTQPMPKLVLEYKEKVDKIIEYSIVGEGSGKTYDWVANVSDLFGSRKIGSEALEKAIDYNVDQLKNVYGFDNVHTENVTLPNWVRGEEKAYLVSPRFKPLAIIGLGSTVGTDGKNLTADATVVTSWDDLAYRCNLTDPEGVYGKIVIINHRWDGSYGVASQYRTRGASEASKCGAVATLIRSASSFSVYSPHTGQQYYADGVKKIATVSVAPEDADLMERMQMRKEKLTVSLYVSSYNDDANPVISRNTIFHLPGSMYPNEMVMISGHFDSWDVGSGAMDNGGGAGVAMMAIANLKALIDANELPQPKRTIRGIHWTAEEPGLLGSKNYYQEHKDDNSTKYVFLQEADEGFFKPLILLFSGSPSAKTMFQEQIYPLVKGLNASLVSGTLGDAGWWAREGVPGVMQASDAQGYLKYFSFHHSEGDTPSVYERNDLDVPTAIWAALAYTIADMNETLPIGKD